MSQRISLTFKKVLKYWFIVLVLVIIVVAVVNLEVGIWLTFISIALIILSYIPTHFFKKKLMRFMKKYYRIDDGTIAKDLYMSIHEVQDKMFKLSQEQEKEPWLIAFLNKKYIFYHPIVINYFKEMFEEGYTENEIFEKLKEYDVKFEPEIKVIRETLIKLNRLEE